MPDTPPRWELISNRIALALAPILSLLPPLAFLSGRLKSHFVANSDHLLLPEVIADLTSGGSLTEWSVPYATFLFPDWPLYSISMALTPNASLAVAGFAFGQTLFLFAALHRLARVFDQRIPAVLALAGLSAVMLAAVANALPVVYLATAYTHFGTAILLVFSLGFLAEWVCSPASRPLYWSAAIAFVAVASDRIFVVWFLIPATATLAVLLLLGRVELADSIRWVCVHIVASVAGLPWGGLIFPLRTEYELEMGFQPRFGLRRFREAMDIVDAHAPYLFALELFLVALIGLQLARRQSLARRPISASTSMTIGLFYLATLGTTIGSQIAMTGQVPPGPRYNTHLFLLPLALAPIVTAAGLSWSKHSPSLRWVSAGVAGIALAAPILMATTNLATEAAGASTDHSPVASACISEALADHGSTHGIASYWDARTVEVFSNGEFDVAPMDSRIKRSLINAGLATFDDRYDFAVTSEIYPGWAISTKQLDDWFGPPLSRTECGRWTVSDWGPEGMVIPNFASVGDSAAYTGCQLSSKTATPDTTCRLTIEAHNVAVDYLVFGPYAHLSPGTYEVTATYSSSEPASTKVGDWDVALDTIAPDVADMGALMGTGGQPATVTSRFEVSESDQGVSLFEWRLVTAGSVQVTVDEVRIARLD